MKIAIVQEWLTSVGGSDKVVKAIYDVFPDADIYTLVSDKNVCFELGINYQHVHNSFIQKLPLAKTKYRFYLPLFPFAIEQFDLRSYDVIISSSHAVAKGIITDNNQLHICYCHSPIRYAWDLYHQYLEDSKLNKGIKGLFAKIFLHKIRLWDLASSFRVDYFISNSNYIKDRIKKIYRREATTIYPNVDVDKFKLFIEKEDFYLAASRLVPYKKIDVIVEAFNQMPEKKLVVVGDGPEMKKIKSLASENVEIMGFQPFDKLHYYMQRAKAFIFAANEDFGIMPLEAQACGTPVIALKKGGALETVIPNKTGLFFEDQSSNSIIKTVNEFEKIKGVFDPELIRKHAEKFSESRFKKEIKDFILKKYSEFKQNKTQNIE